MGWGFYLLDGLSLLFKKRSTFKNLICQAANSSGLLHEDALSSLGSYGILEMSKACVHLLI